MKNALWFMVVGVALLAAVVFPAAAHAQGSQASGSAVPTRNFGDSLIDGRAYLHDSLTIPFQRLEGQRLDPIAPVGLRIVTDVQLSLVSAPFTTQAAPGFGLELAAFQGYINFTVFVMPAPFDVHFGPGQPYLFSRTTMDGGADVTIKWGVFVGITVMGVLSIGPAWLSMDADSFRGATSDPLYTALVFSFNPVALLRLFGGAALATGEPRERPATSAQAAPRQWVQETPPEPFDTSRVLPPLPEIDVPVPQSPEPDEPEIE